MEKGYYINAELNGFGEKYFKNRNCYIGEFVKGIFDGQGILKNASNDNWVSGMFSNGTLQDLLEYNNNRDNYRYAKIVESLHERKTNWINN